MATPIDPALYHQFTQVRWGFSNGRRFFYGRRKADNLVVRCSLTDAMKSAKVTEAGLEFDIGWIIPYDDIEGPIENNLPGAHFIYITKYKYILVFKSALWQREVLQAPPRREVQPTQRVGMTITFNTSDDPTPQIIDIGMPQGMPWVTAHIYASMRRRILGFLDMDYDTITVVKRGGRTLPEASSPEYFLGEEPDLIINILEAFYFRDTFLVALPLPERKKKSK